MALCLSDLRAVEKYGVAVHAFVLMTNHVHLLVTSSSLEGVPRLMETLGQNYVRYVNGTYKRAGTLWNARYKACLVANAYYFLAVSHYIKLNPVKEKS